MDEREQLRDFFKLISEDKRQLAYDTIDEYVFFKNKVAELKELPLIRINKKNPEMQLQTPAAKMIKEYSQVVDAKRTTLLRIINSVENSAADELMDKLKEFEY